MNQPFHARFHSEEEEQELKAAESHNEPPMVSINFEDNRVNSQFLDPGRDLTKRSYSLQPDMATGWKPKKSCKMKVSNVFSINYEQLVVDQIVRQLYKNKKKHKESLVYLEGPRQSNSYLLHQDRPYDNPYTSDKKSQQLFAERAGIPNHFTFYDCFLKFNSNFEGGNLDAAIQRTTQQFDLFMRVDTNTRGHTNWFFFEVQNKDFIGTVTFNICNFRRQISLYQRGLKPYIFSTLQDSEWKQSGKNVQYERTRPRYPFLYDEGEWQDGCIDILSTLFAMSFTYDFVLGQDTVKFAYCVPYTYTKMMRLVAGLQNVKIAQSFNSLSGLPIPVLKITDQQVEEHNMKVVLVTARVHPGQSNSSFVAEGMVEYLCGREATAYELRKMYIFYIVPMVNPDGVVAGNYRTSLFGKDLNRTFHQSRKFAFPQTFFLIELAKQLKLKYRNRFSIYLDLHGHSVKKNVFMYGPDFNIQHQNYNTCRELPRLLSSITSWFHYYSCVFRISSQKSTTARAILNRTLDIPFTYTMQSSNGFYYDSVAHEEVAFTARKWREMGVHLCKGLHMWMIQEKNHRIHRIFTQKITKEVAEDQDDVPFWERMPDDQISEGKSDCEPSEEDLDEKELRELEIKIEGKEDTQSEQAVFPQKYLQSRLSSNELRSPKKHQPQRGTLLPPINALTRALMFINRPHKKEVSHQQLIRSIELQLGSPPIRHERQARPRFAMSQRVSDLKNMKVKFAHQESSSIIVFPDKKKRSRYEKIHRLRKLQ